MNIHVEPQGAISVVAVEGDLDALTAEPLWDALDALITQDNIHLVIDMAQVRYCSSAGIRTILKAMKAIKTLNGKLCLAGMQNGVYRTFDISGIFIMLQHYPDVETALTHWE